MTTPIMAVNATLKIEARNSPHTTIAQVCGLVPASIDGCCDMRCLPRRSTRPSHAKGYRPDRSVSMRLAFIGSTVAGAALSSADEERENRANDHRQQAGSESPDECGDARVVQFAMPRAPSKDEKPDVGFQAVPVLRESRDAPVARRLAELVPEARKRETQSSRQQPARN